ncbi:MAG: 6,7-dimethyl-8-ribityllumazine synthase [Spirochaetales bacterium]|nr:6,7-dimethyl-8-ribityllumazine synthase [Spirochaetales bacterium]
MNKPVKVAIIISNYYSGYRGMLAAAEDEASKIGAEISIVSEVPGCFDMPLPVKKLLQRNDVDAVVALGVILPVPHKTISKDSSTEEITVWDETIANGTIDRLDALSLEFDKPVVKELIGPGFPVNAVKDKVELYARAGVSTAVQLVKEIERISII